MTDLRLSIAQLNPCVGDVAGNLALAREAYARAIKDHADLVVFSELFLSGYPPEDLVLRPVFIEACREALEALAQETSNIQTAILIGVPWLEGGHLYNAIALLKGGRIEQLRFKHDLPNYGVFDEKRVFHSGSLPEPIIFKNLRIGIPICEDIWAHSMGEHLAQQNLDLMIVVNGSPYWRHKTGERLRLVRERAAQAGAPIVYVNQVGGQDELVFDGASFVMQPDGHVPVQCPAFARSYQSVDFKRISQGLTCQTTHHAALPQGDEADYAACVLGLRDYVTKSGFKSVILGLSGGIDSALCAAMAVDALGADKVQVLMLPYRYTSQESLDDAFACAKALGIDYHIVPIEQAVDGLSQTLRPFLKADPMGITAENLQSRARGTLLMAVSNTTGAMVITTGNKSEMAVGYATLYGDMNGGFNPIKDLYKMDVYALSALRNRWKPHDALGPDAVVIPERILTKAPSAELRDHQTDQDSLPPYPVLDAVLKGLIEHEKSVADLVHEGFDETIVMRVLHLLHCAEYKRRQSAPGVKITRKNFGRDRRYPITQRFHQ